MKYQSHCALTAGAISGLSLLCFVLQRWLSMKRSKQASRSKVEMASDSQMVAVNYHFTRECNYACGFCFHTAKNSDVLPLESAKRVLSELRQMGCQKINFAGGEPFLPKYQEMLGEMVKHCKVVCGYKSVSIISNGRHVTREWFERYGEYVDILGVSCDSAVDKTNKTIGRGKGDHIQHVRRAAAVCKEFKKDFKLNTVVTSFTWDEDMSTLVNELRPMRWKIFQALPLEGENTGEGAKRSVKQFLIDKDKFQSFVQRHQALIVEPDIMRVEDNSTMQSSYVLVDEHGCFLDSSTGGKKATASILDVGVQTAWEQLLRSDGGGFDSESFIKRDGAYNMSLMQPASSCAADTQDIEDLGDVFKATN